MVSVINKFQPDVLFIGLTAPKQEKWGYKYKNLVNAKLICCIGAVFDWYAGKEKIIAPIWWKLRLAWLIRSINRPEIFKRYPSVGIFFCHLFLAIIRVKKFKNQK
jgi:N-acetylglucosaminyldiphosphoundecaprenol N-acetyl-beta-D-mannosaminyltransferase